MQFRIRVASRKSGAEGEVVINAPTAQEAEDMANSAGLLVCSVTPVPSTAPHTSSGQPIHRPLRREPEAEPFDLTQLGARIQLIITICSAVGTVASIAAAIWTGNHKTLVTTGIVLFLVTVVSAYKWCWNDQGPWR